MRKGFVIHHNGPPAKCVGRDHTRCVAFWDAVRDYHVNGRGWSDIAYSFGVCPHGTRFFGRGWDKAQWANGADVVGPDDGRDSEWYSVLVFVGGDTSTRDTELPTPEMVKATAALIAEGRRNGLCGQRVLPHSAFKPKPCPGPHFTAYARAWDNQPLPTSFTQEDAMTPEQLAEIKAHVDTRIRLALGYLATGKPNSWINPGLEEWAWADDATTFTLPEIATRVPGPDAIAAAVVAKLPAGSVDVAAVGAEFRRVLAEVTTVGHLELATDT